MWQLFFFFLSNILLPQLHEIKKLYSAQVVTNDIILITQWDEIDKYK